MDLDRESLQHPDGLAVVENRIGKTFALVPLMILHANTTALLLQDLQNDLVKGSRTVLPLDGGTVIANCRKLLTNARALKMPVVHVRTSRRPDLKDAPRPPFGAGTDAGIPILIENTWGSEIVSELGALPEEPVVTKHTTSPFHTTDIGVYLRRFGVTTLILTGYSTTGVVESMLRDARDFDYNCVIARDCCAAATAQEHEVCMSIIFPRMARVATANEIMAAMHA